MYRTVDSFYPRAGALRAVFDKRFANPLQAHSGRFVWDYWHVPGEYTHLRTPAFSYFPSRLYDPFHRFLVQWGRTHLGCHDISPPWLSSYVEGCRQEPHQDVPHGPLAFVYSLTRGGRFRGGETFLRPRTRITPKFNRLILFNPALVHGVTPVRGTFDPRHGRLVVHGWFVNPRPFWVGPLTVAQVQSALDSGLSGLPLLRLEPGFISARLHVSARGEVTGARELVNTFASARAAREVLAVFERIRFPRAKRKSTVTLPLMIS